MPPSTNKQTEGLGRLVWDEVELKVCSLHLKLKFHRCIGQLRRLPSPPRKTRTKATTLTFERSRGAREGDGGRPSASDGRPKAVQARQAERHCADCIGCPQDKRKDHCVHCIPCPRGKLKATARPASRRWTTSSSPRSTPPRCTSTPTAARSGATAKSRTAAPSARSSSAART